MDVVAEDEKARWACSRGDLLLEPGVVRQLADYFDQYISEVHHAKPITGQEDRASSKHPGNPQDAHVRDPCTADWAELRRILEPSIGGSEADFDRMVGMLAELVEFPNMRDWHVPYAKGHPAPHQSCAKFARGKEGDDSEITYCGEMFPRDPVIAGHEFIREGPTRPDLFRIWLRRNCAYVSNSNPLIILSLLSNMDIQGCASKYGVTSYVTKYITRHGAKSGSPQFAADRELDICLARPKEDGKGERYGVNKWFNSQVAPGVLTQLEVCRVNWGFPRYISPMKFYYIYLKSDLKAVRKPADVAAEIARGGRWPALRLSLIELHETRCERIPLTDQVMRSRPFRPSSLGGGVPFWGWIRK